MKTSAKNKATDKRTVAKGDKVTIVDTITYKNLVVGQKYRVTGEIHTAENTALAFNGKKITATVDFTPTKSDDTVQVTFPEFSTETLSVGLKMVVFESMYPIDSKGDKTTDVNGMTLLEHKDMKDSDQTIEVVEKGKPEMKTTATFADGSKSMVVTETTGAVTVNDNVCYKNLDAGQTYLLYGTLVDKGTGSAVSATSSKEFTPTSADGCIVVPINVDASKLAGRSLVAFEDLYLKTNKTLVLSHRDLNDVDQTVSFTSNKPSNTDAGITVVIAGGVLAIAGIALALILKKKKNEEVSQ
jgi:hypothetical protein